MEQSKAGLIPVEMDRYKGVVVEDMALLADTEQQFEVQLADSIKDWKSKGARSI